MTPPKAPPWPSDITYDSPSKRLLIQFDDGAEFSLAAELLRVESPSAEVKGHGPGQKTIIAGRRHVAIIKIEPVGNYAVRLVFDDLHDTGLFTWRYLYDLGQNQDLIWQQYLAALAAKGFSRDPPPTR